LETFVVLGVYDQLGLKFDAVAESQTVMEFVVDQIQAGVANSMTETPSEARNLLQQFEFPKTRWDERISILSGGERRRLQLLSVLSVVSGIIRIIKEYSIRKI
jgi:ATP-binding cassette subfamily F protein uup